MTRTFIIGLQCLILSIAVSLYAQRGAPQAPRPDNAQSLEHINAAKRLRATIRFSRIRLTFSALQGMRAHKTTMLRI